MKKSRFIFPVIMVVSCYLLAVVYGTQKDLFSRELTNFNKEYIVFGMILGFLAVSLSLIVKLVFPYDKERL